MFGESGVLSLEPARLGQQHLQQDDNLRLMQIYVSIQQLLYCIWRICLKSAICEVWSAMLTIEWQSLIEQIYVSSTQQFKDLENMDF